MGPLLVGAAELMWGHVAVAGPGPGGNNGQANGAHFLVIPTGLIYHGSSYLAAFLLISRDINKILPVRLFKSLQQAVSNHTGNLARV